jgi:hypothetical protein
LRRAYLLSTMLLTALLCLSGIGVAAADSPQLQKNQILVEASCEDNSQEYTFVINGMSKTGDVEGSTSNVVVKKYNVQYIDEKGTPDDPQDDVLVGSDEFEFGNKKALENGDLISCRGVARDIELEGLGLVTAQYDFQAFVTPRGKA